MSGYKLVSFTPHYDYTRVGGGHFTLKLETEDGQELYDLGFVELLEDRLKHDEGLFNYIGEHHRQNKVSDVIKDLYSLGAPLEEWINDYMIESRADLNPKLFSALLNFYNNLIRVESSGSAAPPPQDNEHEPT